MAKICYILIILVFSGCGEAPPFEKYLHEKGKGRETFLIDFEKCKKDKDKYSNKIQGREFGFEGQDREIEAGRNTERDGNQLPARIAPPQSAVYDRPKYQNV